ncbi:MAG TPA: LPS-assembly protein LptD, partial [Aquificaceae bacterium]|nr:LPS-assembly protein LptD [Aquificaceae bacterium]
MVWLLAFLLSLSLSFGIEILSKTLYTDEDGKVIAEGEVFAEYGEYTVRAHRVVYDPRSRTVFAYGNVRIKKKDGSFEVEGEEAFLDLEKEKGYFLDARGRFKSFYFSAKRVEKRDKEEYIVLEGDITTCPPDDKEMKVCFWKAHVSDRYVISFSNSLRFFKIPIAYFPLVILPTGERRSGLLPPIVGQDTYNTFIYIQPFYWAISGDRDATLM